MNRTALVLTVVLTLQSFAASAQQKTTITRADELPRRTYQLTGKAAEVVTDREQLDRLAAELKQNVEGDLAKFDIEDDATLNALNGILLLLALRERNHDEALTLVARLRELESKPAAKLTSGLFAEALIKARREVSDESSPAFRNAFERHYTEAWSELPYDVVKDYVEAQKGQLTLMSRELLLGSLQGHMQQLLDNTKGAVPEGVVAGLLNAEFMLETRIPLKDEALRVMTAFHDANSSSVATTNIWESRDVALKASADLKPVVVGVWDSGVDMAALPAANRWTNKGESVDGKDNDRNGYVDDVHGIGYDMPASKRSVGTLIDPAGRIKTDVRRLQVLTKGYGDLNSSVHSEEAAELQKTIASLKAEEVKAFSEELGFYSGYSHGTHVAGIIIDGNPAAKIVAARMSHAYGQFPEPHTMEKAKFTAQMYRDIVDYFKKAGVKVVNMSWRYNSGSIEASLTVNGIGRDEKERKELAREMFEIEKRALYEAITGAPSILFVCGSGNEDNDANFSEYIPATFDLPNLITIGAVDSAGKKAAFTTEGKSVDFFANGFEVESFVPGGDRMKMSGTSMASPQVANLAAKLLALHPKLTPQQLIAMITAGSERSEEDPEIRLIHPAKSLSLAAAK
ncbi:MAG: S8 family serine peptidase [Thermoanaerobaculia bacterium]